MLISEEAPVVIFESPNINCSEILPPIATAKSALSFVFGIEILSLSGSLITIPKAIPLGIIVAL